jgi:hypothetical protein
MAIFALKVLKNHEFQGLGVSEQVNPNSEPVHTNFEVVQSFLLGQRWRRPKRQHCKHLRRRAMNFQVNF